MVGASKILTVSYGTFSCTLEGFDEPFSTMKAIAEYFRDLAADDRYFGAEPPTPDAQMLHQIAEREIQRRVEAKIQENGVILKAEDEAEDNAQDEAEDEAATATAAAAAAAPVALAAPVAAAMTATATQEDVPEAETDTAAEAMPEPTAETPAEPPEARMAAARDAMAGDDSDEDAAAPTPAPTPVAIPAASAEDAAPEAPAPEDDAPLAADSIAAKLLRIRAAVNQARETGGRAMPAAQMAPVAPETGLRPHPAPSEDVPEDSDYTDSPAAEVAGIPARDDTPAAETTETTETTPEAAADTAPDTAMAGPSADAAPEHATADAAPDTASAAVQEDAAPEQEDAEAFEDENEAAAAPDLTDSILAGALAKSRPATDGDTPQPASDAAPAEADPQQALEDSVGSFLSGLAQEQEGTDEAEAEAEAETPGAAAAQAPAEDLRATGTPADEAPAEPAPMDAPSTESVAPAPLPTGETPIRPRARVIKVRRVDPAAPPQILRGDETTAATGTEETEDTPSAAVAAPDAAAPEAPEIGADTGADAGADTGAAPETGLSPEDEADLMAELAAVERELGRPQEHKDIPADIPADTPENADSDRPAPQAAALEGAGEDGIRTQITQADDAQADDAQADDAQAGDAQAGEDKDGEDEDEDGDAAPHRLTASEALGAETAEDADGEEAPAVPERAAGRSILETSTPGDTESVNRLMRQTESELKGPESRRRFATIAHLKAAVAATVADRKSNKADENDEEQSAEAMRSYRDDLARVVRPRRPSAGSGTARPATQRPLAQTERPAPLVLVSEQRIDRPEPGKSAPQPIRPRRVTSGPATNLAVEDFDDEDTADHDVLPGNAFLDSANFAEFAERIGATSLPDLLEAAAAYSNCVEGVEHFTRPQIMRFAAAVREEGGDAEGFSREAGLRSFGQLLREGTFTKVKRGQFAISQSSRFIPEAKKIAR